MGLSAPYLSRGVVCLTFSPKKHARWFASTDLGRSALKFLGIKSPNLLGHNQHLANPPAQRVGPASVKGHAERRQSLLGLIGPERSGFQFGDDAPLSH
jgi:hypothetical protein